jgi:hypothetical protein
MPSYLRTSLIAGLSLMLVLVIAGAPAGAATPRSSLASLARKANALPITIVSKSRRRKLAGLAKHARRVVSKKPCSAVADLNKFRRVLGTIKIKKGKRFRKSNLRLAALGPTSLKISQKVLGRKSTKKCGGGVAPSTRGSTKTTVMKSDENGMVVHVDLPQLHMVPETGGGKTWTKLLLSNTDSPGKPGTPGIPEVTKVLGVPDGATLQVGASGKQGYTLGGVDVFPAQPQSVDDTKPPNFLAPPFAQKPFTIDNTAYKTPGLVPAAPADGGLIGSARDLLIGNLLIPTAQYNPVTKQLNVITSLNLILNFNGGQHTFNPIIGSQWELGQQQLLASLLNATFIRSRFPLQLLPRCGEEMLVITNPTTLSAANTFAAARRAAGIRTTVVQTGAGSGQIGTTATQIQTFIRSELTALGCIHPSYVTIIGDDKLVPTFAGINGIPSDLAYSLRNDTDELPDVAVGRILGNDLTEVNNAVTKIIGYETTAPTAGDFLTHATIGAQFQDDNNDGREDRTFVTFAETVRNGLIGRGVAVDRVYGESPGNNPQQFNDGTSLPPGLKKPAFGWNGTAADVTADWNAGRFMLIHRDHGYSDGWGLPSFGTANVNALTNGSKLPVLLSINCSSAAYDYDDTSFVQTALVKPDGGAVGAFGDTRDSPSWSNTQIALGFVDALLPSVLPAEGPANKQRMGDALITGKLRLAGLAPPPDGNTRNELYLWHYFGDPSMQMWGGGAPLVLHASDLQATYRQGYTGPPVPGDPPPYEVVVNVSQLFNGQAISLLRNGQVVGKAFVENGVATIPASFGDGNVKPGDLEVAFEPVGAQPVNSPVQGVPQPTTLTQTCQSSSGSGSQMTTSGNLDPGFAGAKITITYSPPDNQPSFTRDVTTDANGNWSDTIVPALEVGGTAQSVGTWTMQSHFAGDAGHRSSTATACTTDVFDNS